jgi:oxygen-independent coproporphyrinogen-3 oxidase
VSTPSGTDGVAGTLAGTLAHWQRPGTLQLAALPPLSVYVHLPWCLRKCPYCDFNSHEVSASGLPVAASPRGGSGSGPAKPDPRLSLANSVQAGSLSEDAETRYLDALCADLEAALPLIWGRRVVSVFIGGGTPSLFSPAGIERLLADLRARLPLEPGCEITLEANPGTFERDRFRAYRAAGVTRLSVGVQSFDDDALVRLGRVHSAAQAQAALAEAAAVFDTFNIDLMYALPQQDLAALARDLDTALAFAPPHLSVYHLTIEPNTAFSRRPPAQLPDDDLASDMLDLITARTAAAGLERYEVSAFARAGHRCRHNLNYWQFGDYLGLGAGAHGKLSFAHRVLRQVKWRDPATYMERALTGQAVSNEHEVSRRDLPFEFMMNALRLRDGFALSTFSERTGLPLSTVHATLGTAAARGLLTLESAAEPNGTWVRPSVRGFDFLSDLQGLFLPAGPPRERAAVAPVTLRR